MKRRDAVRTAAAAAAVVLAAPTVLGGAPAAAQSDLLATLGTGAEAKAAAGAGQLAARGAPAAYYNPANLALAATGVEPYVAIDVAALTYRYRYPGYAPTKVTSIAPIPFLGVAIQPETCARLTMSASLLPIPAGTGSLDVKQLPMRLVGTEPMLVDVEVGGGDSMGYRASLAAAYRLEAGASLDLSFGIAALLAAGETQLTARDATTQATVLREATASTTRAVLLGMRASGLQRRLNAVVSLRPPATTRVDGRTELPTVGADAVLETRTTRRGPLAYGAGVEGRVWRGLSPFAEVLVENWSALRRQTTSSGLVVADTDYFDTTDVMFGAGYVQGSNKLTGGYGIYQSHLGQGILKSESADGRELIGQEFRDVDGLPYEVYAVGYTAERAPARISAVLAYARGDREVWAKAKGYGAYQISLWTLTAAWAHQL